MRQQPITLFLLTAAILCFLQRQMVAFVIPTGRQRIHNYDFVGSMSSRRKQLDSRCYVKGPFLIVNDDSGEPGDEEGEEEDEEEDEDKPDPYMDVASSEFLDDPNARSGSSNSIVPSAGGLSSSPTTVVDWGGALGRLRERVEDVESGESKIPSKALFRLMSSQPPNQAIGSFISRANPQVIEAMSSAVGSLLGGLASPQSGIDVIVKASGDKIGSLCFQLQMTGYMFRNAEYVMALKKIMDISGSATLDDYKEVFDKLDKDGSGYIEGSEVRDLLDEVYKGETPYFEINTFVKFFDKDSDGRVSWEEFKLGLGAAMSQQAEQKSKLQKLLSPGQANMLTGSIDDGEDEVPDIETSVSGTIEIEMYDGETVTVDAAEYIESLKEEASLLKQELRKEKLGNLGAGGDGGAGGQVADFLAGGPKDNGNDDSFSGIANYIASRKGDIKSLTEGISPEIVDAMKLLVDFVLEGGGSGKGRDMKKKEEISMAIPASALQQLALWQLILGYQLREAEAKGDYLKLLE